MDYIFCNPLRYIYMDDFGIITKVKEGGMTNFEVSFSSPTESATDSTTDSSTCDGKKPLSRAHRIVNDITSKLGFEYAHIFQCSDMSNEIQCGREIVVSNKMIDRSNILFSELMNGPISASNINLSIVYACSIVSYEYIKTWEDKQSLVLIILREYISKHNGSRDNKNAMHLFIESHVPIIVEKILHPKKKRFQFLTCCK
jgi:hypothetical protein